MSPSSTTSYSEAIAAIDTWRAHHVETTNIWWLRHTTTISEAQAEVIDRNSTPIFAEWWHLWICNTHFVPSPENPYANDAWATTIVTDAEGTWRGSSGGFWITEVGVPFAKATVCLNTNHDNDQGTIAHELGHVLGLNELTGTGQLCPNTGHDSVMAYNYTSYQAQWPPFLSPSYQDVWGPWVCNTSNAGGLAWVYDLSELGAFGFGTPVPTNTPTNTPTRTPTPTRTFTPTPTRTPTPTPVDLDFDGFLNPTPPGAPPVNTDTDYDNCPYVANSDQLNTDGNFIDNSPPFSSASDDNTAPFSDRLGNACDTDDDNDGVLDANETAGCNGSGALNPLSADTDGDRFLDGPECVLGSNPGDANSHPSQASCGPTGDTDEDRIPDRVEVCHSNTDPEKVDSDSDRNQDGTYDGCEVASLNGDLIISSGDQGMLSAGIGGGVPYTPNLDLNKDGVLSSGDQGIMGSLQVPQGQCPA